MIGIRSTQGRIRKPAYSKSVVTLTGSARTPVVRRLAARDLPAIQTHLLSLSDSDRDRRFNSGLSDSAIKRYTHSLDFTRMVFTGAFDIVTGQLIGLAEAHLDHAREPFTAEMSVSVMAEHRGRKMGADLLSHLFAEISERGARKAVFFFQPSNRAMSRLLKLFGNAKMLEIGFATITLVRAAAEPAQRLAA